MPKRESARVCVNYSLDKETDAYIRREASRTRLSLSAVVDVLVEKAREKEGTEQSI